jgi:stearoyl-CoA desaturase (delta-9 desaturase)
MTLNFKIRSIQFINLFLSIIGIAIIHATSNWWLLAVSYFIFLLMCPLGISTGLHRLMAHRSFRTNKFFERLLTIFSIYGTVGSPIAWVAMHRMHHAYSDTSNDPHTPYQDNKITLKKFIHTWFGVGKTDFMKLPISFVKDLIRDPFHKFVHENYFKILLIPVAILFVIDPLWGVVLYSIPATFSLQTTSVVNVLGHSLGYRNYHTNDFSTNSWVANIFSLGEGWHNNHHGKPSNPYIKEKWWEWDLIGSFIKIIRTAD